MNLPVNLPVIFLGNPDKLSEFFPVKKFVCLFSLEASQLRQCFLIFSFYFILKLACEILINPKGEAMIMEKQGLTWDFIFVKKTFLDSILFV